VLFYFYICDVIFVTRVLKSDINYIQPHGQHLPPPTILGARLLRLVIYI